MASEKCRTFGWTGAYMLISSMMLIVNKLAISFLQAPSFILLCQLFATAAVVQVCAALGIIAVDPITWRHIKPFSVVAAAFLATIFANIKTLQYANVETFIIFRVSTPLALCVLEYQFLGRQLPDKRSAACLVVLLLGAVGYVLSENEIQVTGYFWVCIWFVVFLFDMIYLKHAASTVEVVSNWTRVFYSNFLPCFPLVMLSSASGETAVEWSTAAIVFLSLSCVMGVAMSYVSWQARSMLSATQFSILGNICKFLTIIVNCLIWNKHATPTGLFCLTCSILAGYFYKQAPLREGYQEKRRKQLISVAGKPDPESPSSLAVKAGAPPNL